MNNTQLRYVFDRKNVSDNDSRRGLLQIEVRLTGKKDRVLISTGIYLFKNQFSPKNGFTCRNHDNAVLVTGKARNMFRKVEAFVLSDKCVTLKDAKNWNAKNINTDSFIKFVKAEMLKKEYGIGYGHDHKALIGKIEAFENIKTFQDLTYDNICDFDLFLRKTIKTSSTL
ncbi:MAG: hypothetical protein LBJ58_02455, partial [Tannerellaceae bacterium]|nr:hypothetical protein [Tannerellaceae bacterium]